MTRARDLADFNFDGKAVTINESSADLDFRVESDNLDDALFVQGSDGIVGVGIKTPAVASGYGMQIHNDSSAQTRLVMTNSDTGSAGTDGFQIVVHTDTGAILELRESADLRFATGATERMRLASDGDLGIGTASPNARVDIRTAALGTALQLSDDTNYGVNMLGVSGGFRMKMNGAQTLTIDQTDNANVFHINGSGNLGIGHTSPTQKLHVSGNAIVSGIARLGDGSASSPAYQFVSDTNTGMFNVASDTLAFSTGGSEKLRLDSNGKLYLGTTSTIAGAHISHLYDSANGSGITLKSTDSSGSTHNQVIFDRNGSTVGTISTTASNTAYGTTSDRRLKLNIEDAESASDKIDALQVRQFDWNVDGSHQDFGLVAQELQPIAPTAVSGDADSDEMMAVDYSKLVPMLIKEIQELRSRVATLEAS